MARPKTYDDDLRQRLISRAADAIVEHGPGGLALRPVAHAEGTSTTAVYSIFGGRAGLIAAVGKEAREGFVAAQRSVTISDDPVADLYDLARAYRSWAQENPTLYQVLMLPSPSAPTLDLPMPQSEAAAPLSEVVLRLIATGAFPDVMPERILASIWSSVHGFVSLELAGLFAPATDEMLGRAFEAHLISIADGWTIA